MRSSMTHKPKLHEATRYFFKLLPVRLESLGPLDDWQVDKELIPLQVHPVATKFLNRVNERRTSQHPQQHKQSSSVLDNNFLIFPFLFYIYFGQ